MKKIKKFDSDVWQQTRKKVIKKKLKKLCSLTLIKLIQKHVF